MLKAEIIVTGDIMLGGTLSEVFNPEDSACVLPLIRSYFKGGDIIFGNLEAPLSARGPALADKTLLLQHEGAAHDLEILGYNIFSLANNHIMDYGPEGLSDTIDTLDRRHIRHIGAGRNMDEAVKAAEFEIKGLKISFLGYVSQSTDKSGPLVFAGEDSWGIALFNLRTIEEGIAKARSQRADAVVVSLHWGGDRYRFPFPAQREEAHAIVDMGADIIIGHHSHIFQGIEKYKAGVIIYSMGNFLFGDFKFPNGQTERWGRRNKLTAYVRCVIKRGQALDYKITPLWIGEDFIPRPLVGIKKEKAAAAIKRYSELLMSPDYKRSWNRRVFREEADIFLEKIRSAMEVL